MTEPQGFESACWKWDFLHKKIQQYQEQKYFVALPRGLEPLFSP
jgi:hypothetical protein